MRLRTSGLLASAILVFVVTGSASGGFDESILLPDSLGGIGHPDFIAWNAANNLVYVGSPKSPRVVAFDAGTCNKVAVIDIGHPTQTACANARENKVYAALTLIPTIVVVDGITNAVVRTISAGERGAVDRLCLNTQDNKLYCLDDSAGVVHVVDCHSDVVIATLLVGKSPSALVYDSVSGSILCANKNDSTVSVIDGTSDSVTAVIRVGGAPQALCPVADFAKLYCANGLDGTVSVIDCSTMSVRTTLPVGRNPSDICYAPGVGKVYCVNSAPDSTVTAIDCNADSVVATINVHWSPTSAAWWPHRNNVFVTFGSEELIAAIDTKSDSEDHGVYVRPGHHSFAFASSEGTLFCTSDYSGTVTGILNREPQYTTITVGANPYNVCVSPKSGKLYCTDTKAARIAVANLQTDKVTTNINAPGGVWLCYNTRNDKLYASAYSDDLVFVIDGLADTVIKQLETGPGPYELCYDSLSNRVYCADFKGRSIEVFDGSSDSLVATITAIDSPCALAAAPDLRRVYYTSWSRRGIFAIDCENNQPDTSFKVDVDNEKYVICYNPEDQRVYFAEDGMFEGRVLSADAKGDVHNVMALPGWCEMLCYDETSHRLLCLYSPNYVYLALGYERKIAAIDYRSRRIVANLNPEPGAAFMTAGGGRVYVVCSDASSIMVFEGLATLGKASPLPCPYGRTKLTGLLDGPNTALIYDLSGRLRSKQELVVSKSEASASFSDLPAGVYFVRMERQDTQGRTFKVVYVK